MIVDTDIGPWPDDIGAFSILHSFADQGLVDLLAIVSNNRYEGAVAVIDAMNSYFNRSTIPIGITHDPHAWHRSGVIGWPEWVLAHLPHRPHFRSNEQAEEAVSLYRRTLAAEADHSVTLLSIGYMTNLANLLHSSGDHHSPLSGRQLLIAKVKHMFAMAGWYPAGNETNLIDQPAASQATLPRWPTPLTLVGFEAGEKITCGMNLIDPATNRSLHQFSPVAKAFELYNRVIGEPDGCFDELAAYVAVKGTRPLYELQRGQIVVYPNGNNSWIDDHAHGPQQYVKQVVPNQAILDVLNPLLER